MAPEPQKRQVLVLGANGKLGRMLTSVWREYPAKGIDFSYVSRHAPAPSDGYIWQPDLPIQALPKADTIVALWGVTPGSDRDFSDNSNLAVKALDLAQALGARRVLHCSSSAVYQPSSEPLLETSTGRPPSPYGQAKLAMEQTIARWHEQNDSNLSSVILRLTNVAGADGLFNNMKPKGSVTLDRFEDGQGPRRSYIGSLDLAKVIETLANAPDICGIINIAAPRTTPMEDLAKAAGCDVSWKPAPPSAIASVMLETSRLQNLIDLGAKAAEPEHLISCARQGGVWP
ncbi:MAG: NAD-dependent epimerase/dehydratase family protein [Pelagimonas sp.]|uniref:NAD-dependent epimerase/dehydratase family protein n=1 Tax=Pelagimonas sp. TaxID=2073170 RepID=UPI003D6B57FD